MNSGIEDSKNHSRGKISPPKEKGNRVVNSRQRTSQRNKANGCFSYTRGVSLKSKPVTESRRTDKKPVETRTEIKIPVKKEEIERTKKTYVKRG